MALDTLALECIKEELREKIIDGKVEKVYQPEKDEIMLSIRTFSNSYKLTLSASPVNPRIHFQTTPKENPKTPPMFCMLLRKHLTSGKIVDIRNVEGDRILIFDIESYNELGDLTVKHLIVEIMGRHSNIILTHSDLTIIDSIKHIDFTMSSVRQVLPGMKYEMAPPQDKVPILSKDIKDFSISMPEQNMRIDKLLLSKIGGISPLTAREITYRTFGRADISTNELDSLSDLTDTLKTFPKTNFKPCIITERESGRILDFSAIDIMQYESLADIKYYDNMSELLEDFYKAKDSAERIKQKSADILKILSNNIAKISKKIAILNKTLLDAKDKEKHKKYGDLITANLFKISTGDEFCYVTDYYSQNLDEIKIPLKPELSPSKNAQRYYKLYNKAKTAEVEAAIQLENAKNDLEYLESTLTLAENSQSEGDINAIRTELTDLGYIKARRTKKKQAEGTSKPHHFISSDGFDIYVGKNNTQNDKLTLKFANSSDMWFHTKNIHGSHVLIKLGTDKNIPDRTLLEAAGLAAYFSKARESSNVPVDYTIIKNVKKPNGAKPGMVIYDSYNTVYVNPKLIDMEEKKS